MSKHKQRDDHGGTGPGVTARDVVTDSLRALADAEAHQRRDRAIADAAPERSPDDRRRISQILATLGGIDLTHAEELLAMSLGALRKLVTVPNVEPMHDE